MTSWEHQWRSICQGKSGFPSSLARGILWTLSHGYHAAVFLRNIAYNRGILRSQRPKNCVIVSVGNLVAGGTGKTPLIMKLAQELSAHAKVAVLSRGYKSAAEQQDQPTLIQLGHYAGDEPTMIANRLPQVQVFAGKNRRLSAKMAVNAGAKILLIDDGLQHRQLHRDLEIVVIDGEDPFGCGYYLPRGFLRDSPLALKRADLVVVNQPKQSVEWLAPFTPAPIIGMEIKPAGCQLLHGTPTCIKGKKVSLFCGIAKPEKFRQTAQTLGAEIISEQFFPDHAPFSSEQLQTFASQSQKLGAELVLCTEKDQIKLSAQLPTALPVAWLQVEAEITLHPDIWTQFLQKLISQNCHNPLCMVPSSCDSQNKPVTP